MHVEHIGPWTVHVASVQGARPAMEDAWRVLPEVQVGVRRLTVAAVFDGVGGAPNGGEAARAAAGHLEDVLGPGMDGVLQRLNEPVLATGGASTAVIVGLDARGLDGGMACVGDSSIYTMRAERLQRLTPRDASGPFLTDHLGHAQVEGHVVPLSTGPAPVLLCTDGVDGVVAASVLEDLLRSPSGARTAAFEMLFDEIEARGAPDNATAVLLTQD